MSLPLKNHLPIIFAGELSAVEFEDLCCDVWDCDSDILRANRFGRNGQKQRGVDILAWNNSKQLLIGSCKNYEAFDAKELNKAIGQFWKYLAHWKKRRVVGLVIFVGSQIQDVEVQTKYLDHLLKFSAEGLSLELRDNVKITNCLRENRNVGIKYFPAHVQSFLYGATTEPALANPSLSGSNLGLSGTLRDNIYLEFTADVEKLLPNLRKKARSGRWSEALADIEDLRSSQHWHLQPDGFDDSLRSKVLILSAALQIDAKNDIPAAKVRIQQAKAADPSGKFQVVESVIALREQGPDRALELLTNPESTDAWNIKLSILTNLDRCAEVLAIVASPDFAPNSGTYRVASLAAVVEGEFYEARRFIALAIAEAPGEFHIRLLAASLRYLEAILPSFKDIRILDWPVPPGWEFVQSDPDSLKALNEAEVEFSSLLKLVETDNEFRISLEAWRLACLANHPSRQEEAAIYAAKLLSAVPAHIPALVWAVERGFPFDHDESKFSLQTIIQHGGTVAHVQALCTLLIESSDLQAAADQMDRSKAIYRSPNEVDIWRHLRVQLAAGLADDATLSELLKQEEDPKKRAHLIYASSRVTAAKNKDVPAFVAAANQAYDETGEAQCLLEACDASLVIGDFKFVVERADELLSKLPSSASLLVASHALLRAGLYTKALALIETHSSVIPESRMGNAFKRIQIECNHRRGDPSAALKLAESCAQSGGGVDDQIRLLLLQSQGADIPGSLRTAKLLLDDPQTPVHGLVEIARSVRLSAPQLASSALQLALGKEIPEETLTDVISLGFHLGLDDLVGPYIARLVKHPQGPDSQMRLMSFEETRELLRKRRQTVEEFLSLYQRGLIPIHFGDTVCGYPLFSAFLAWMQPETNGIPRQALSPVFIRSGIHASRITKIERGGLALDFTSLLIADQLGILEIVEAEFAPLVISTHALFLFRNIAESIVDAQPLVRDQSKTVLSLLEEGIIHEEACASKSNGDDHTGASTLRGVVEVRDKPNQRQWTCALEPAVPKPTKIQDSCISHVVGCVGVDDLIAAFRSGSIISNQKEDSGTEAESKSPIHPPSDFHATLPNTGDEILLAQGVARRMAADGVLEPLARLFILRITRSEREMIEQTNEEATKANSQSQHLIRLIERIHRKQAEGIYQYITKTEEIQIAAEDSVGEATMALYDLHLAGDQGATVIWTDDRFINGFAGFENSQIVGVSEVLEILRERRKITRNDYFNTIASLRAKNFRYLFTSIEEIQWCLSKSEVSGSAFKAGPELVILRRYIASCLLDSATMRQPDSATHSLMEFRWAFDVSKAVNGAIGGVWADNSKSETEQQLISDYLLSEFYFPLLMIFELVGKRAPVSERIDGLAGAIAGLMMEGFALGWPEGVDPARRMHPRARYYDWIADRILTPYSEVEPTLLKSLAKIEFDALIESFDDDSKQEKHGAEILRILIKRAVHDLPEILSREIAVPPEVRKRLRLGSPMIQAFISGSSYHAHSIWRGISKASRKGRATVTGLDSKDRVEFFPLPGRSLHKKIGIKGAGCQKGGAFTHDALPVVTLENARIQGLLKKRIDWLDHPKGSRTAIIRAIVKERDPAFRVQLLLQAQDASLEHLYVTVRSRYRSNVNLTEEDLYPKSAISLANHLRIDCADLVAGNIDLEKCAANLLEEIGLARTLQRFVHLPVPIPEVLIQSIKASGEAERNFVFARLIRTARHPLARLQTSQIIASIEPVVLKRFDVIQTLIDQALNDKEGWEAWDIFERILNWSFSVFGALDRFRELHGSSRLLFTWLHAGRLSDIFLCRKMSVKDGGEVFLSLSGSYGLEIGAWNSPLWNDCAHPRFAGRVPTLMAALGWNISRLPVELGNQLRRASIDGVGGVGKPDISAGKLFMDTSLMRNSLGSFLGGNWESSARDAMTPEFIDMLALRNPSEFRSELISQLESNVKDQTAWNVLDMIVGDFPIDSESETRIRALISSSGFAEMLRSNYSDCSHLIRFSANRMWHIKDESYGLVVEKYVHELLAAISSKNGGDATGYEVSHLLESLMGMSISLGNEVATQFRFYELLSNMIRQWPEGAKFLARRNWRWPNKWPMNRQAGYWKFELTRRSVP